MEAKSMKQSDIKAVSVRGKLYETKGCCKITIEGGTLILEYGCGDILSFSVRPDEVEFLSA
jgi:hypothetical protein